MDLRARGQSSLQWVCVRSTHHEGRFRSICRNVNRFPTMMFLRRHKALATKRSTAQVFSVVRCVEIEEDNDLVADDVAGSSWLLSHRTTCETLHRELVLPLLLRPAE